MDEVSIRTLLVFAIAMQNGQGIRSKAPDYITDKWETINMMSEPEGILDDANLRIFNEWKATWKETF